MFNQKTIILQSKFKSMIIQEYDYWMNRIYSCILLNVNL